MSPEEQNELPDKIGKYVKIGTSAYSIYNLVEGLIWFVILVFVGVFVIHLVPLAGVKIFVVLFLLVWLIAVSLNIISLKKISSADLNSLPTGIKTCEINFYPEEKVAYLFAGIVKTFIFMRYSFKSAFFGIGQLKNPENTILVTDKHVLFLYVPLAGGDKVVGMDIGMLNYLFAKDNIKKKLNGMLSSMSLKEIYDSYPGNFGFELADIIKIEFNDLLHCITFFTKDEKIYKYSFRKTEDFQLAKQVFVSYIS